MRLHAPDQLNERSFPGWPGIEQERRNIVRAPENYKFFNRKIDIGKAGVVTRPTFCGRRNRGAQNLAALHIGRALFLFGRLGMKRTFALRDGGFGRERAEDAMIGNRDPGKDRERDSQAARGCLHAAFNR